MGDKGLARAGGADEQDVAFLDFHAACAQSFTISFSPTQGQQSFDAGLCDDVAYTITPSGGFNASVTVTPSTSQSGLTAILDPNTANTVDICATTSVPAGNYPITLTATGGGLTKTATWSPFVYNFTISGSPASVSPGSTGTSTITVNDPVNQASPTVSLSATGQPSGVTVSFNPATLGANPNPTTSTMNVTVASGTTPGPYTITVTGIMLYGGPTQSTSVNLTVTSPVTASPGTANTIAMFTGPSTLGNSIITQSGNNVGIGTTTPLMPLQIGPASGLYPTSAGTIDLVSNLYVGSGWQYAISGYGSVLEQYQGNLSFYTAPSGTAGASASLTKLFTVLNTGNVGIGTTTQAQNSK